MRVGQVETNVLLASRTTSGGYSGHVDHASGRLHRRHQGQGQKWGGSPMVLSCSLCGRSPDDLRSAQEFVEDTSDDWWSAHVPRYKTGEQENPPAPIERETSNSIFPIVAVMQRQNSHPSIAIVPLSSRFLQRHSRQQMHAALPGLRVAYERFGVPITASHQDERVP